MKVILRSIVIAVECSYFNVWYASIRRIATLSGVWDYVDPDQATPEIERPPYLRLSEYQVTASTAGDTDAMRPASDILELSDKQFSQFMRSRRDWHFSDRHYKDIQAGIATVRSAVESSVGNQMPMYLQGGEVKEMLTFCRQCFGNPGYPQHPRKLEFVEYDVFEADTDNGAMDDLWD